ITASKNGVELDRERTQDNLAALIETGEGPTALPVEPLLPAVTSDNMEMKVMAKFSTDVTFRGSDSRSNVATALSFFNGYVVYPGDTCDFNAVVGPRTIGRGFKEAPEYAGNEKVKGVGGGVCQASTTLYDALIMADMTILQRSSHNMTVSYVEPSQDAAVEYMAGGKNLVFRNDTEHAIYIYTNVDRENATVTIYGTRPKYHYELISVIVEQHKSERVRYEYDYSGKYVYYVTDPPKLKTEGHGSCQSEGWVVAYDWDTKQEVSREQISYDAYVAGMNVYWKGVHDSKGNVVNPNAASDTGT
ncbi:MAG: VanW family protein, partial [Clostridia bacterium]|nr:VanW family protein [Clostridia bacterium]